MSEEKKEMNVDTIAARNKRIKVLEAQRADDAATIKRLLNRIADLEDELLRRQEAAEARVTLADRLAEAVRWWVKFTDRESFFPDDGEQWEALDQEIREALAAYEAGEPVVRPDAAREGRVNEDS
jgi:septal ring factor EnvC (AmiA/AmiB activator)